ncbi:MAG: NAD(P)/FAD-dependent oxidoreductase [Syntrophales bacterium]|jgi:NADH dehydrogenase|nr:NAD(P)/FAD-dependent oxidoreductase [Syntrophales bacterium]MCK9528483.1 NAD(P)/FAD-dependent oxidoreductase [Syntrophales bacterium]MDX9923020.1 NAD(P)/FAD-dependent oxidoreductase [Syntrophales bacterium]
MNAVVRPRVVIVGAGFGGLWAARTIANESVEVVLVDRNNYHTFLALLYQVAAALLEAGDISYPVRSIFRKLPNVSFVLAHVHRIDVDRGRLKTDGPDIPFDYLIVATGSITDTLGVDGVAKHAYFLKTLEEGVALKNHIICCFEAAAGEPDEAARARLLTFVIVGGGATGVEYAGALNELVRGPLSRDYRDIDFSEVKIVLLEAADRLVGGMPGDIQAYTAKRLEKMGVDVRFRAKVDRVTGESVTLDGGETIPTRTVVWTAGVRGEPLPEYSGIATERDGRVPVLPTLQVQGHPHMYVVGDLASLKDRDRPLPLVAQVAIQSAVAASRNIIRQAAGKEPLPFSYHDRGSMITIGRNSAGVAIGPRTYRGFFAWVLWLTIHLFYLIGFRNRIMVFLNWAWDYLLYERAVRFVFPAETAAFEKRSACFAPGADSGEPEHERGAWDGTH